MNVCLYNQFSKSLRSLANVYSRLHDLQEHQHPFLLCHLHMNFACSKSPNFACTIVGTLLPFELLVETGRFSLRYSREH